MSMRLEPSLANVVAPTDSGARKAGGPSKASDVGAGPSAAEASDQGQGSPIGGLTVEGCQIACVNIGRRPREFARGDAGAAAGSRKAKRWDASLAPDILSDSSRRRSHKVMQPLVAQRFTTPMVDGRLERWNLLAPTDC